MRAIVGVGLAVVAALSVTKLHLVRAETGARETRLVIQQPFAMPIDSADAFCLRRLDQPTYQCAMAFVAQRDAAMRVATLPYCAPCARVSKWMSSLGRAPQRIAQRERDFETLAGMAFDKE